MTGITAQSHGQNVALKKKRVIFISKFDVNSNLMMNTTADGNYYTLTGDKYNFCVKPLELDKPTFEISVQGYTIQRVEVARSRPVVSYSAHITQIEVDDVMQATHISPVRADFNPVFWRSTFDDFAGILLTATPI